MAIRETLNRWWEVAVNIATTPVIGTNGAIYDSTPPALKAVLNDRADAAHQARIVAAREFDSGEHATQLTERLEQFLGLSTSQFAPRLNFTRKVNRSIAERLVLEGFKSDAKSETEAAKQVEMADTIWRGSRMQGKRASVMQATVRDGEHFILIDWDAENARPRWTPHQRYTDPRNGGDGEGMFFVYPNSDPDQKPEFAVKRWVEKVRQADGTIRNESRIYLYFDNRVEKYAHRRGGWTLTEEPAAWVDKAGAPLGIPAVHLKAPTLEPAAIEAIPIQKGLNKTYIDMLAASDMEAFRLIIALGFDPTNGGEIAPTIDPGMVWWTDREGASVHEITPSDSTRFIQTIDKQIALMADVTDTPLSLLQRSNQRAAEGTLQEEKEGFIAKVRDYAETIEMAFEDALKIARRVQNTFGSERLDETADFSIAWQAFTTRSVNDRATEAAARIASGYSIDEVQRSVWGEDESVITRMEGERGGQLPPVGALTE